MCLFQLFSRSYLIETLERLNILGNQHINNYVPVKYEKSIVTTKTLYYTFM